MSPQTDDTTPQEQKSTPYCLSISPYLQKYLENSVHKICFYEGDIAVIKRRGPQGQPGQLDGITRGEIEMLSKKSLRRMFFTVATSGIEWESMLTVTYPDKHPTDGKQVKRHLKNVLQYLRDDGCDTYFWFLEFQRRGAPHFHILTTQPALARDRRRFANYWAAYLQKELDLDSGSVERIVRVHSHYRSWERVREQNGAAKYVAKYAYKTRQKEVPEGYKNVGRFWGATQNVKPVMKDTAVVDGQTVRAMLSEMDHKAADWDILPSTLFGIKYNNISSEDDYLASLNED